MRGKFGRCPVVVSKKGALQTYTHTDTKGQIMVMIVNIYNASIPAFHDLAQVN